MGLTQRELAKRANIDEALVRKYHQGGVDKPRGQALPKLAKVLGVSAIWLEHGTTFQQMTIPALGIVGAGEVFYPDLESKEIVELKADDLDLFCLTVRGESGLPVYKPGEVVICSRAAGVSENQYLNKDCAVMLTDGRAFLKRIGRGTKIGTYTLHSYNGAPIENVLVNWVAPVVMVVRDPSLIVQK
jgi:transcriptional regulator with XRE-family HTH domain